MTWLLLLFSRRQLEEQLDKEVHFHLDQHAADLIARPDEAIRSSAGEGRMSRCPWHTLVEDLLQDFRFALRALRQRAGFAAVTLSTLALGIRATTVMFTVINGVLLKPLSYPDPERLVTLHGHTKNMAISGESHTPTFSTLSARVALSRVWPHGITAEIP